jgi:hypothetical protein
MSAVHFVWITICAHDNCTKWTQTGTYQGTFAGGSSSASVHSYYENVDDCGYYYAGDVGIPPTPNYAYYISWDLGTTHSIVCDPGFGTAYNFEYRRGSIVSAPFFVGTLPSTDGLAMAKTEVQGGAPIGTDRFGCDHNKSCNNGSYGLHLFNGTTWPGWTGASTSSNGNPPYVHTYHNYWAFATCPVAC